MICKILKALFLVLLAAGSAVVAQTGASSTGSSRIVIFDDDIISRKQESIKAQLAQEFSSDQARLSRLRARYNDQEAQLTKAVEEINNEYEMYVKKGSWTRDEKADLERRGREAGERLENHWRGSLAKEVSAAASSLEAKVTARRTELEKTIRADFENFKNIFAQQNKIVLVPFADVSKFTLWVNDKEILQNKVIEAFETYATSKTLPATDVVQPTRFVIFDPSTLRRDLLNEEKELTDAAEKALQAFAGKKGYSILLSSSNSLPSALRAQVNPGFVAEFQSDYDASDSSKSRKIEGFLGLRFGSTQAEARAYFISNKIGRFDEKNSSKSTLFVEDAYLNYEFLQDRKVWVDSKLLLKLGFVGDKLFSVRVYLPEITESAKESDYYTDWIAVEKELDKILYDSDESGEFEGGGRGTTWRYRHPDGYDNLVQYYRGWPRSYLLYESGKFDKEVEEAARKYDEAEKHYNIAAKHYSDRRYDLAIVEYTNALKADPERIQALHFRGHSYGALGKTDLAFADFDAAIKLDIKDNELHADLLVDRAYVLLQQKIRLPQALADASKAIKLKSNMAKAFVVRAMIHCAQGKKEIAVADEESAVGLGAQIANPCK